MFYVIFRGFLHLRRLLGDGATPKARPKRHAAAAPRWTGRASAVGWEFPSWRNFRKIHVESDEISRWDLFGGNLWPYLGEI